MHKNLICHINWFRKYAANKIALAKDKEPLDLKLEHTFKVFENAMSIIAAEQPAYAHAASLAALYHDIARFDQYLVFGTFSDAKSCNHGLEGVRILKRQQCLACESLKNRHIIMTAVALHNRYKLPEKLEPDLNAVCRITRDADKLDILRVMSNHLEKPGPYNPTIILGLPDTDKPGNPKIIEYALNKKIPAYTDLLNVNDFRLLLGLWFFDMHFQTSKKIFINAGYGKKLVEALPDKNFYEKPKKMLLAEFEKQNI